MHEFWDNTIIQFFVTTTLGYSCVRLHAAPWSRRVRSCYSVHVLCITVRTRTKVEEKDEKFLVENLTRHAPKWRDIGAALRFLASELDSIETIPELTDEQRLEELLHRFVRWPTTAHPHAPTMEMFKQGEMVRLGISNIYDYRDRLPSQLDCTYV